MIGHIIGYAATAVVCFVGGAILVWFKKPEIIEITEEVTETFEDALDRLEAEKEEIEQEIKVFLADLVNKGIESVNDFQGMVEKLKEAGVEAAEDAAKEIQEKLEDLEAELEHVKGEIDDLFVSDEE